MGDTLKPVTVVTQFLTTDGTDDGQLSEMVRYYVQDGNMIQSPTSTILGPDDTDHHGCILPGQEDALRGRERLCRKGGFGGHGRVWTVATSWRFRSGMMWKSTCCGWIRRFR